MSEYYQRFVIGDVPAVLGTFLRVINEARSMGETNVAAFLERALVDMEDKLTVMSERTVAIADEAIVHEIHRTAKRAPQTRPGGLIDQIHSEPIVPTAGIVGIARKDGDPGLDNLTYWRAQEYGLEQGFVGRVLHGFFYDLMGQNPTPPEPHIHDQPIFEMDPTGGFGVIQHPIQERRFLEHGTAKAAAYWRREQRLIFDAAIRRIRAVQTQALVP